MGPLRCGHMMLPLAIGALARAVLIVGVVILALLIIWGVIRWASRLAEGRLAHEDEE